MVKAQSFLRQPSTGVTASSGYRRRSKDHGARRQVHATRPTSASTSSDQVQIQMYLSKLKELVPHMPKDRKVSKLEVIQHVIDYICQLQSTLETQPRHRHLSANARLIPADPSRVTGVAASAAQAAAAGAGVAGAGSGPDASVVAGDAARGHPQSPSGSVLAASMRQPLSLLTSLTNVSPVYYTSDMIHAGEKNASDCNVRS